MPISEPTDASSGPITEPTVAAHTTMPIAEARRAGPAMSALA
jgi:hypothetical protein